MFEIQLWSVGSEVVSLQPLWGIADCSRIWVRVRPEEWALDGFEFWSLVLITGCVKTVALAEAEGFWDGQGRVRVTDI